VKKTFILFGFILTTVLLSNSFWDGFFKETNYGKPFVSEIHSTANKLEMGYDMSYDEYNIQEEAKKFDRPVVIVDLGVDIPLYAMSFGKKFNGKNKWGWSLSLPVSIHLLEDMFESVTAPLINTDFNFGAPQFNLIRRFNGNGFIKNISLSWLPFFHQCTHLGDEIIIYRTQVKLPIIRVNISYYYTDLKLTINDPDGSRNNLNSLKLGFYYRLSDNGYGWFSIEQGVETTENINIKHSEYRTEYYLNYRNQRSTGFLASKKVLNIFSFEAKRRVRLNYPSFKGSGTDWIEKQVEEGHIWSFNLYFGWKFFMTENSNRSVGMFLRLYKGLNPFGQMRNNPNYKFIGLAFTYDL